MRNTFQWIHASIPVHQNWYECLHQDVVPFIRSADVVLLCDTWFYELGYNGGATLEIYLYAETAAAHEVILPALRQRFGKSDALQTVGHNLLAGRHQLHIERWSSAAHHPNALLGHYHESTKLYCRRRAHRRPGPQVCFAELCAGLMPLLSHVDALPAILRGGYQNWLHLHFATRYAIHQLEDRQAEEQSLTTFLEQRAASMQSVTVGVDLTTWVAATRAAYEEGPVHLVQAIASHIGRYGLEPFEGGLVWIALCRWTQQQTPNLASAATTAQ